MAPLRFFLLAKYPHESILLPITLIVNEIIFNKLLEEVLIFISVI